MMLFLDATWNVVLSLAPSLLLGAVIAGVLHGLLPADFVARHLRGGAGVFKAVAIGVPLPLCSCGVLPAGLALKRDGATDGASVAFLISTPQTGVDSILVSGAFLGLPFALFKVVSAAVTGVVGGLITDRVVPPSPPPEPQMACAASGKGGWRSMLAYADDLLRMIWRWLVFGILVSAAIEVFVPDSIFQWASGLGIFGNALAALAVSLPLYVCATASVPIAAALVAGGMPAGAALVFLMAGPATNVATMGAIYRAFGRRTLSVYLGTIIIGSMGFGLAFDTVLGATATEQAGHHEHLAWWQLALAIAFVALLLRFALEDLARWWRARRTVQGVAVEVGVEGMRCNGCVSNLEKTLLGADGVTSAVVTLEPGGVVVEGSLSRESIADLVRVAGYEPS